MTRDVFTIMPAPRRRIGPRARLAMVALASFVAGMAVAFWLVRTW